MQKNITRIRFFYEAQNPSSHSHHMPWRRPFRSRWATEVHSVDTLAAIPDGYSRPARHHQRPRSARSRESRPWWSSCRERWWKYVKICESMWKYVKVCESDEKPEARWNLQKNSTCKMCWHVEIVGSAEKLKNEIKTRKDHLGSGISHCITYCNHRGQAQKKNTFHREVEASYLKRRPPALTQSNWDELADISPGFCYLCWETETLDSNLQHSWHSTEF